MLTDAEPSPNLSAALAGAERRVDLAHAFGDRRDLGDPLRATVALAIRCGGAHGSSESSSSIAILSGARVTI
jgi:hypothetical protein